MDTNQNQPTQQQAPVDASVTTGGTDQSKRPTLIYLSILGLILIAVAAWALLARPNSQNDAAHQLTGLSQYKLAGKVSGRGISFDKPSQLTIDTDPSVTLLPTEVGFNYLTNGYSAAYIAAESPITIPKYTYEQQSVDLTKKWLNSPNNSSYVQYATLITNFVTGVAPLGAKIHYYPAQNFTNPNIKSNAWKVNFDYGNPVTNRNGNGTVVYAIGKNGEYLFIVLGHHSDWQANRGVINQILNSIKIDQT